MAMIESSCENDTKIVGSKKVARHVVYERDHMKQGFRDQKLKLEK